MSSSDVEELTVQLRKLTQEEEFICSTQVLNLLTDIDRTHMIAIQAKDDKLREQIVSTVDSQGGADIIVKIVSSLSGNEIFETHHLECRRKCYSILLDFSDLIGGFLENLLKTDIVKHCIDNLKNKELILSQDVSSGADIIQNSLLIVYNIARLDSARTLLRNYDWTCLDPYREGDNENLKAAAAMILAYISDGDPKDILCEKESTQYIVQLLEEAKKKNKDRHGLFSCTELIEGLARLAINDDNKETAHGCGVVPLLMYFIRRRSDKSDLEAATKCLYTLAFNSAVNADLQEHREELKSLLSLSSSNDFSDTVNGLLLLLKRDDVASEKDSGQTPREQDGHIMISYSWRGEYGRNTARKIATYFETRGYKVWIDVHEMSGSIIDAMVEALNNAEIFIMCVSDGYRRSDNCRLEAEFAHKYKKKMIPVIFEFTRSKQGDWLEFIKGDRLYFDFSEGTDFHAKCSELLMEIRKVIKGTDIVDAPPSRRSTLPIDVPQWLKDNDLGKLEGIFRGIDVSLFPALKSIKRTAPEFFYRCLWEAEDDTKIDRFISILKLTKALEDLD